MRPIEHNDLNFEFSYMPVHLRGRKWAFINPNYPDRLDVKHNSHNSEILDWLKDNSVDQISKDYNGFSTWLFHDKETKVAFILRFGDGQAPVTVGP